MADDNSATIQTNATKPRRAQSDGVSAEQHSIPDQIAADRYAKSVAGVKTNHFGLRMRKIVPHGA